MARPQPRARSTANSTSRSRQPALPEPPRGRKAKPAVMSDKHTPVLAETVKWAGEAGPLGPQRGNPAPQYIRTANHWAFVRSGSAIIMPLTDENLKAGLDMVAWVCSLSGGLRRATRAYLGYTPMWSEKDQHAWRLQCVYVRVPNIVSVGPESLKLWGHERPAAMLVQGEGRDAVYMLQTPDPNYAEYWQWYAVCEEAKHGFRIPPFLTDPLKGPIPPNLNRWACNRIRQELGIPHHPDDPANGSLLTPASIRREGNARKLATTGNRRYTQQWLKGDDENGESDASSTTADPASDRDDENATDGPDEVMGDPDDDAMGEPDDTMGEPGDDAMGEPDDDAMGEPDDDAMGEPDDGALGEQGDEGMNDADVSGAHENEPQADQDASVNTPPTASAAPAPAPASASASAPVPAPAPTPATIAPIAVASRPSEHAIPTPVLPDRRAKRLQDLQSRRESTWHPEDW